MLVMLSSIELDDASTLHHRLEPAPHGFDLGEFGHEESCRFAGVTPMWVTCAT